MMIAYACYLKYGSDNWHHFTGTTRLYSYKSPNEAYKFRAVKIQQRHKSIVSQNIIGMKCALQHLQLRHRRHAL